jgi:hypothetical protein
MIMSMEATTFAGWLAEARVREDLLTPAQHGLLASAFQFVQRCGTDYYSLRLLSHFLVHCQSGLKLAQIARLLGINRWTASSHQGLSSKEVIQGAHHRAAGRVHGKLLPRYAGAVAQFLVEHPKATRYDLLAFIERTWGVSVSRVALHHFLKKYGLDDASRVMPVADAGAAASDEPAPRAAAQVPEPPAAGVVVTASAAATPGVPVPRPPEDFFLPPATTPAPSSSCPKRSTGSGARRLASKTPTVPCGADC